MAIPFLVIVSETKTISWWDCCQILPGKIRLHELPSFDFSLDLLDDVQASRIPAACLCDGILGYAWSNNLPNFGCPDSNNIGINLACSGTVANENACPLLLCALDARC